jgi:DNA polymerase III epsilon subunit-like protein
MSDKPRGYFEKFLVIDCETTGLCVNGDDPSFDPDTKREYQAISWGLIIVDAKTLKPIEEKYIEIKWNGDAIWDKRAQAVHGLSPEYLEENGLDEEEAVVEIASLIMKYFGPSNPVKTCGHNVTTFDVWFLKRLLRRYDIEVNFGNRHLDTSTIGFVCYEVFNSDDLFDLVGVNRNLHNALEDARASLKVLQTTRAAFKACLDG